MGSPTERVSPRNTRTVPAIDTSNTSDRPAPVVWEPFRFYGHDELTPFRRGEFVFASAFTGLQTRRREALPHRVPGASLYEPRTLGYVVKGACSERGPTNLIGVGTHRPEQSPGQR
jgi:hypothetical protein